MFKLFEIAGDSLFPLFKDGQRVLCKKVTASTPLTLHDTVVFYKEPYGMMMKRVEKIEKEGYYVKGTTPFSKDSRDFGILSHDEIAYKVICSL